MILIWALLGQMGRPGSGYSAFGFLANDATKDQDGQNQKLLV